MWSLPIIRIGIGKMPMINKCFVFPVWEMLKEPLKYPGYPLFAMKSQAVMEVFKRNKHTDKDQSTPQLGFGGSGQPTYDYSPNAENQLANKAEQHLSEMDDREHYYHQKHHYRNLKEKILQKAPLWEPKQHLKRETSIMKDKEIKKKVAEVYFEKNADSFPLKKSDPFPKE